MALPSPKFYSTGNVLSTGHDFGSCEAGAYNPGSTGKTFRLYNDYGGSLGSDTMTSVKISIRDDDGGIDEDWTKQHWIQIKSSSGSTGVVDDAQTVFTAVGKNKELSLGDIPSGEYRTLFARCYPPTDAAEQNVDFQLRVTYQQPATSICNWITGLRGNGVVASTGDPLAMSTGGTTGEIPYTAGYALIYNNEIYFGSSGTYDCSTGSSGTNSVYLTESGSFGMTTGSVASNQLELYEATISSGGVCTALSDKRNYLTGIRAGTTGAMGTPDKKGDLYLDITNAVLYVGKTSTGWTSISANNFIGLTDTPADFSGDASKILRVNSSSGAVEFVSSTGLALDGFGTPSTATSLNATTGLHGLLPSLGGGTTNYLRADGSWATPTGGEANTASNAGTTGVGIYYQKTSVDLEFKAIHSTGNITVTDTTGTHTINLNVNSTGIKLDDLGTPDNNTDLNATTGKHGLLLALTGTTSHYLTANGTWAAVPGSTGGEANTASNAGTTGVGIYYTKAGVDLEFKAIHSAGDLTVTDSTGTHTIDLSVSFDHTLLEDQLFFGQSGFTELSDVPFTYSGQSGKIITVATGEAALEFLSSTNFALDSFGTATTGTSLNATTGVHGLLPVRDGDATHWLDGSGAWTAPTASEVGALTSSGAFTAGTIPEISSTGGVLKASPFAVTTGDVFNFGAHSAGFTEQAIATTTGSVAINWNNGNKALYTRSTGTAGGVATFTFTAPAKSMNLFLIVRGTTAGCTGAVTLPTAYWGSATYPTFSTGASALDGVAFYYSTGLTSYLGMGSDNFSTV